MMSPIPPICITMTAETLSIDYTNLRDHGSQLTKTALITGCSEGGIGHALALEFSRRGVHVFATARTPSKMASLEGMPNITLLAMDVTSQASVDAAAMVVGNPENKRGGALDFLVNNAGGQVVMPVLDLDMDVARQIYEVNFWGMLAVIKTFAPLVIRAKGAIANLSSIGASLYMPYLGESRCVTYTSLQFNVCFSKSQRPSAVSWPWHTKQCPIRRC